MTQKLEKVAFTINVKTSTISELKAVISRTMSANEMFITPAITSKGGKSTVYLEATGFDKLQLDSFKEWAEDFAKGHHY